MQREQGKTANPFDDNHPRMFLKRIKQSVSTKKTPTSLEARNAFESMKKKETKKTERFERQKNVLSPVEFSPRFEVKTDASGMRLMHITNKSTRLNENISLLTTLKAGCNLRDENFESVMVQSKNKQHKRDGASKTIIVNARKTFPSITSVGGIQITNTNKSIGTMTRVVNYNRVPAKTTSLHQCENDKEFIKAWLQNPLGRQKRVLPKKVAYYKNSKGSEAHLRTKFPFLQPLANHKVSKLRRFSSHALFPNKVIDAPKNSFKKDYTEFFNDSCLVENIGGPLTVKPRMYVKSLAQRRKVEKGIRYT